MNLEMATSMMQSRLKFPKLTIEANTVSVLLTVFLYFLQIHVLFLLPVFSRNFSCVLENSGLTTDEWKLYALHDISGR